MISDNTLTVERLIGNDSSKTILAQRRRPTEVSSVNLIPHILPKHSNIFNDLSAEDTIKTWNRTVANHYMIHTGK